MASAPLTTLYVALLSLMFCALSVRVLRLRSRMKLGIGDGGDARLQRAVRVHANFSEYVPLALLLMLLMEINHMPALALHIYGGGLLMARAAHAFGVSQVNEPLRWRVFGTAGTLTLLIVGALALLLGLARH